METIQRALKTTLKQIKRSGWLSWASVAVMTLSFVVATVFLILAFTLNLVLKSIENDPHIYIFYKPGVEEAKILTKKEELENLENIESVIYTSEAEALTEFRKYNEKTNPITAEAIRENVLPASLGIRLKTIESAQSIITIVEQEKSSNPDVLSVGYSETVIHNIKQIVNLVRVGGATILGMLGIVILLFTLLTTEFKIYYRAEEIGVMQLVGGSLAYIRLPFIIESAIYGMLGALVSNLLLLGSYFAITYYYSDSSLIQFVNRFFGNLSWPNISIINFSISFLSIVLTGGIIGIVNSFLAIRRYIK